MIKPTTEQNHKILANLTELKKEDGIDKRVRVDIQAARGSYVIIIDFKYITDKAAIFYRVGTGYASLRGEAIKPFFPHQESFGTEPHFRDEPSYQTDLAHSDEKCETLFRMLTHDQKEEFWQYMKMFHAEVLKEAGL